MPEEMNASLENSTELDNSHLSLNITDQNDNPLDMVVGALMFGDELIGKGLSNNNGNIYSLTGYSVELSENGAQ